jgi:hypothetical protein
MIRPVRIVLKQLHRLIDVRDQQILVAVAIVVKGDQTAGVSRQIQARPGSPGEMPGPVIDEQNGRRLVNR